MGNYLSAIWRCRFFWLSLVRMDLRTRYRRSILGLGWSLLNPILMTLIICMVFHKIWKADIYHFAPYLLAGLAGWAFIVSSTTAGCQSLFQGESYIRQYPAPLAIYPLRTTLGATIHFLLALVVVFGLMVLIKMHLHRLPPDQLPTAYLATPPAVRPSSDAFGEEAAHDPREQLVGVGNRMTTDVAVLPLISLVPTLCVLFVFCWSLAILSGFSNVYFQDTQHLCEVGFQLCFYSTPIMYEKQLLENNGLSWLLHLNPFVPMLDLVREPVVEGRFPHWSTYAQACVFASVAASAAVLALARLQRRVIFYM